MDEAMQGAAVLIETVQKRFEQRAVPPFIQEEHAVGNAIRGLQKAALLGTGKVGYVAQVTKNAPSGSEFPESANPQFCPLMKTSFRKYQEATLCVVVVLVPPHQKQIKAPAKLRGGIFHRFFSVQVCMLFDGSGEEHDPRIVCICDNGNNVIESFLPFPLRNIAPKTLAGAHRGSMKIHGWGRWKMLVLNLFERVGKKKGCPFIDCDAAKHEIPVGGIVFVSRFINI